MWVGIEMSVIDGLIDRIVTLELVLTDQVRVVIEASQFEFGIVLEYVEIGEQNEYLEAYLEHIELLIIFEDEYLLDDVHQLGHVSLLQHYLQFLRVVIIRHQR